MKNLFKKLAAITLAATLCLGTAVTAFAESETEVTDTTTSAEEEVTPSGTVVDAKTVVFTDAEMKEAFAEAPIVYVNGGKVKSTVTVDEEEQIVTTNYKVATLYTSLENAKVEVKGVEKAGKFLTYVTLNADEVPVLDSKGKVDTEEDVKAAKNVVSAKIKNGAITITAGKEAGAAYVWIIDVKADKTAGEMVCIPVTVKAAPKSVYLFGEDAAIYAEAAEGEEAAEKEIISYDTKKAVKKDVLAVGETAEYDIYGFLSIKKTDYELAEDGTYTAVVDEKFADNIEVKIEGSKVTVKALALDEGKENKTVKAKFNIVCTESNKKASVTVTITDEIKDITFAGDIEIANAKDAAQKAVIALVKPEAEEEAAPAAEEATTEEEAPAYTYTVKTDSAEVATAYTSKVKVYVTSAAELASETEGEDGEMVLTTPGYKVETVKGKDKFTLTDKTKDVTAKLAKSGDITLTVKKGATAEAVKLLIVVTNEDKSIDVYEKLVAIEAAPVEETTTTTAAEETPAESEVA